MLWATQDECVGGGRRAASDRIGGVSGSGGLWCGRCWCWCRGGWLRGRRWCWQIRSARGRGIKQGAVTRIEAICDVEHLAFAPLALVMM
jgi:hypothetical protein